MSKVFFKDDAVIPDMRYDEVFKAVFTRENPQARKALSGLVSACIRRNVKVLALNANEPAPTSAYDKRIRYDIVCCLESGELADVEITLNPKPDEPFREEFFAAKLFVAQDLSGSDKEYSKLKKIYQINILAEGKRWKDDELLHCFRFYDEEHGLSFKGQMHIIVVELSKAVKLAREKPVSQMSGVESWAVFLRYHPEKKRRSLVNEILKEKEDIAMAGESALSFSKEQLEYFHNMSKLKYELDEQSERAWRKRKLQEAKERALKKGLKEGRATGRAEGRAEGIAKGINEGIRKTARKMKSWGDPIKKIADITGLSPTEIKKL